MSARAQMRGLAWIESTPILQILRPAVDIQVAVAWTLSLVAGAVFQPACHEDSKECVVDTDCPEGAICNDITDECEQGCRSGLLCASEECVQGPDHGMFSRGAS